MLYTSVYNQVEVLDSLCSKESVLGSMRSFPQSSALNKIWLVKSIFKQLKNPKLLAWAGCVSVLIYLNIGPVLHLWKDWSWFIFKARFSISGPSVILMETLLQIRASAYKFK